MKTYQKSLKVGFKLWLLMIAVTVILMIPKIFVKLTGIELSNTMLLIFYIASFLSSLTLSGYLLITNKKWLYK
jgi:hypothetical protein